MSQCFPQIIELYWNIEKGKKEQFIQRSTHKIASELCVMTLYLHLFSLDIETFAIYIVVVQIFIY